MEKRVYVQMAPDDESRRQLVRIGESLPKQQSGRLLPESELHVTLIHFGKVQDVLAAIRKESTIPDEEYMVDLQTYIKETRDLLTDGSYPLVPAGYAMFGARRTTLVAQYEAPRALHEIHREAYGALLRFLGSCGVQNAAEFAQNDPNFMFARTFNPHITIYKGFDGDEPSTPLPTVNAHFMKLEYDA